MANAAIITPESLTRQVFIYVAMGAAAFLVGCVLMIGFMPMNG
jgi:hypothetical protein